MHPFRFISDLKIRYKLIFILLIVLIPILTLGGALSYLVVTGSFKKSMKEEMRQVTETLVSTIHASTTVAIKNYLKAVAEKNLDIVAHIHGQLDAGTVGRQEAMASIFELLDSQQIGDSGYIFCLNRDGVAVYHPDDSIKGSSLAAYPFIREMLSMKTGYMEYSWQNPGEEIERPKALYMAYFEPLDWIISVSAYVNEFNRLVRIEDIDRVVHSLGIGKTGYAFVTDISGRHYHDGPEESEAFAATVLPPELIPDMVERKAGSVTYSWRVPGIGAPREMISHFQYLPTYGWLIGAAYSEDDFQEPLEKLGKAILGTVLLIVLSVLLLSFWFGGWTNRAVRALVDEFEKGATGDFSARLEVDSEDERGILANHFNSFMAKLKANHEALFEEIKRRERFEKQLQKLAMAVEQGNDIVVITDTSGVIEYVNPSFEATTGYSKEEVIGHTPSILKSNLHDNSFYAELWRTISRGDTWSGRLINRNKNGVLFYEDATITPLRDTNGIIVNYVASKRNVTDQVSLENQLRQTQRIEAIGSLAGGIAHDFNNILSGIMGFTEMCMLDVPEGGSLHSRLERVLQASHRAKDLIGHIQTFSRQASTEKKPVLPDAIVKEAMKLLRASIPSSIEFKSRIEKVGILQADPTQIHQIMMNLCTNAYHAMKESGGILSVSLEKEQVTQNSPLSFLGLGSGSYAKLTVSDTGCGIPEEIREKIFDPYFTTKPQGEGTGLGLSVVHGIVKSLNGHIEAASREKRGTTFTIFLPLADLEEAAHSVKKDAVVMGNGESVLLVDDDPTVLEITNEMLVGLNYRPVPRNSALEALNLFRATPDRFDILVTDLTMPGMNGLKLTEEVKRIAPELPVILCSGFGDDQAVEKAIRSGLVQKLQKPIILSTLAEIMHKRLGKSGVQ